MAEGRECGRLRHAARRRARPPRPATRDDGEWRACAWCVVRACVRGVCAWCVRGACARVRVPQAQLGEQQPGVRARLGLRRARARRRQRRRALGQRALDAVHARRLRADRRWKYTVRIVYSQRATTATDERATLRLTDTSVSNAPGVVVLRVGQRVQFRVPVVLRFELRICTAHQR